MEIKVGLPRTSGNPFNEKEVCTSLVKSDNLMIKCIIKATVPFLKRVIREAKDDVSKFCPISLLNYRRESVGENCNK